MRAKPIIRNLFPVLLFIFSAGMGQNLPVSREGTVTYVTSRNVYVKFPSTRDFTVGDTLFQIQGDREIPALVITGLSSISCVCTPLISPAVSVSDRFYFRPKPAVVQAEIQKAPVSVVPVPEIPAAEKTGSLQAVTFPSADSSGKAIAGISGDVQKKKSRQLVNGYFAVASYTDFSNTTAPLTERMKYTLSLNARNMGNTNLSFESYMSFSHSNTNWDEVQKDMFNGLKIYSLSFNYQFLKHYRLYLGRRINPYISNMGACDGLQFEMNFKPITIGIIGGSRPDYINYGFNFSLLQIGAFVAHEYTGKHGFMQTTLAFIQQNNSGAVDRRFAYFQHSNSLIKNLSFFGSLEVDLYGKVLQIPDSTYKTDNSPRITNLYLSLVWRIVKPLTVSITYNNRQNVIYYETYKNYLDRMLETATLQGYLLSLTIRPVKYLSIGLTGGYRFEKQDPRPTKNVYGYITYSEIPGIRIAATGTYTYLETGYVTGKNYGIGISKDIAKGKLYLSLSYRYVDYKFTNWESGLNQNMGEFGLTWRIIRKLAFSVYYEGTFEPVNQYNRIYAQLIAGF